MKKLQYLCLSIIVLYSCSSADDSDSNSSDNEGFIQPINNKDLSQFTPNQADWSTFYLNPIKEETMTHDPDAYRGNSGDFSPEAWDSYKWDGKIFKPNEMTKEEFYKCLCPNPDVIRGIREVFYEAEPFEDNANPTKAEVDEWHRIAINHVRSLVGYNKEEEKIKKDSCLFIRATWANQRKFTDIWDADYPGGCIDGGNIHCGGSFIPNEADQQEYLADGASLCDSKDGGSEGAFVRARSHIPWSIKWIRPFCLTIKSEGYWGGHIGPWFKREKFGFSFWDNNRSNPKSYAFLRAKWGGKKLPEKYPKPNN